MKRRDFFKAVTGFVAGMFAPKAKEKFDPKPEMFQRRPVGRLSRIDRAKSYGKISVLRKGDIGDGVIVVYDINIDCNIIDMEYNMLWTEEEFDKDFPLK